MGPAAVLEGGPARIDPGRYQIIAKAGDAVSREMMNGPCCERSLKSGLRPKIRRPNLPAAMSVTIYQ